MDQSVGDGGLWWCGFSWELRATEKMKGPLRLFDGQFFSTAIVSQISVRRGLFLIKEFHRKSRVSKNERVAPKCALTSRAAYGGVYFAAHL